MNALKRFTLKVVPPILSCRSTTSEMDVGGIVVEIKHYF